MGRDPIGEQTARMKDARAVALRAQRWTYDRIAASLWPCPDHAGQPDTEWRQLAMEGCPECRPLYSGRSSAKKAVDRALRREYDLTAEAREALARESLATADAVVARMAADMMDPDLGADDRARAGTVLLRAMDYRAKLLGQYAPTRVTVTDELDESIAAALAELSGTPAPESLTELPAQPMGGA